MFYTGSHSKTTHSKWVFLFVLLLLSACKPSREDAQPDNAQLNRSIYQIMKEWYLWNDQLPEVSIYDYQKPGDLLEALRYKTSDKWSYIQDEKTFDQFFKGGQFVGYGFGMKMDADRNIRVSFVYKDSPMDKQGVTRGYKLTKINGKAVSALVADNSLSSAFGENKEGIQNSIEVEDLTGKIREFTVAKVAVNMNTVLHRDVRELNGKKVGYLVFNSFIEKSKEELNEAFAFFQAQGISELILDLRYNGGGSLDIARHLASLIASSRAAGREFATLTYNTHKKSQNKPYLLESLPLNIALDRLFVITSTSSASASEAIINGLKPFMPVITIGDRTHGKPVGMNVWRASGYAIVPITFKVANADGEAEYFNGIPADARVKDDLETIFGDPAEDCLSQALHYIQYGSFSAPLLANGRISAAGDGPAVPELTGFRAEIGAF
jgi:C-terminal processing protease CtpA/Prc